MSELARPRLVVVSGGSKGLGLGMCKMFLDSGFNVATFSRSKSEEIDALMSKYPDRVMWKSVDISNKTELSEFLDDANKKFGRVHTLVNNAGVAVEKLMANFDAGDVERLFNINVVGALALTQLCTRQMLVEQEGVVVNVSSVVAVRGYRGVAAYAASKSALDGFTRSLAAELGPMGIRVNSITPGFMETDMTSELTERQKEKLEWRTPLRRLGRVDDVTSVVQFLASDAARFVTGQSLVVDGGLTA